MGHDQNRTTNISAVEAPGHGMMLARVLDLNRGPTGTLLCPELEGVLLLPALLHTSSKLSLTPGLDSRPQTNHCCRDLSGTAYIRKVVASTRYPPGTLYI
jgi:hypothetical protein